jgi:uncharacterized membrane protein
MHGGLRAIPWRGKKKARASRALYFKGDAMNTPASFRKHPIHPMLVVFPLGLWIFSLISDVIFLLGKNPVWNDIAFYTMAGGLVGALLAAVPGVIDMFSIADPKPGEIAWNHMIVNIVTTAAFGLNLYLRIVLEPGAFFPILLSLIGVLMLGYSGWLGGELAYVHGVGVQPQRRHAEKETSHGKLRRTG